MKKKIKFKVEVSTTFDDMDVLDWQRRGTVDGDLVIDAGGRLVRIPIAKIRFSNGDTYQGEAVAFDAVINHLALMLTPDVIDDGSSC